MTQSDALAEPITHEGTIFRKTNVHRGRKMFITPQNSTMQYLCYARTILDPSTPEAGWENGKHETALILLSGDAEVAVGADRFTLSERDSVYIPRGAAIAVKTRSSADLAEFSAEVEGHYPLQMVRYSDIKDDKSLHFTAGGPATTRDLNILIGKTCGQVVF